MYIYKKIHPVEKFLIRFLQVFTVIFLRPHTRKIKKRPQPPYMYSWSNMEGRMVVSGSTPDTIYKQE
jgi:hypothetical protein